MKGERISLGEKGEQMACDHLRRMGYKVLEQNYRTRLGEIDLIARQGRRVVFVEVKTRSMVKYTIKLNLVI